MRALVIRLTWLLFSASLARAFQDAMPVTEELPLNPQKCGKQKNGENRDYQWVGKDTALAPDSEGKGTISKSRSLASLDKCAGQRAS